MAVQPPCIFLNDNISVHAYQRGVSRYFNEISAEIIAQFGEKTVILSSQAKNFSPAKHLQPIQFRGSRRLGFQDLLASVAAYRAQATLFYSSYYGNAWTKAPQIFTVYDLIPELFPQYYPNGGRFIAEKKRCFERADLLIAISESTAKDIVRCYPHINPEKISVTHLGVDPSFFRNSKPQNIQQYGRPFLLYVGHRTGYKNFRRLLLAFGQSGLAQTFNLRVISPANGDFNPEEVECIKQYRLEDNIELIISASEETLRDSYTQAVALIYPSEYEGFGLPILEAMASGAIVATANVSSMPEIGGKAVFYFDPYSVESIVECLRMIVVLPSQQRQEHIRLGLAQAKVFTWARCRQQTLELFSRFI
jgi:glycosyltransferase involved in cell wall biosynthesis